MTDPLESVAKRDKRLLIALLLFVTSAGSLLVQAWILMLYSFAAANQDWTIFLEYFPSYAIPTPEPDFYCFGKCYPDFPFIAGWIGISGFFLGLLILAYSWWVPRQRDLR